ncbi:MAG: metallophosphoesterase [Synechococcus sp.]
MKVLVGSDYHCDASLQQQALDAMGDADWYIYCGDFCSWAGRQPEAGQAGFHPRGADELEQLQAFWQQVDTVGIPWLFVPGNHEPPAQTLDELFTRSDLSNGILALKTQLMQVGPLQALIVPLTPPCGWCWSLSRNRLKELQATYKDVNVDLLITHAPPKGTLDEGGQWYRGKIPTLAPLVQQLAPRYYLCGHMHLDGGKSEMKNGTTYVNAALHNVVVEMEH